MGDNAGLAGSLALGLRALKNRVDERLLSQFDNHSFPRKEGRSMKPATNVLRLLLSAAIFIASIGISVAAPQTGSAADNVQMKANTNLSGWRITGKGTMEDTEQGMLITSVPSDNAIVMSETRSDDFIFEADVQIKDMKADASLVFRSNADGWSSYMLQVVPKAGLLRLKDARGGDGRLFEERQVTLKEGEIYHLKVKAVGNNLKVYWGSQYKPIVDVNDSAYHTGYLGLHVWDGSALLQNIEVSALNGNLEQTIVEQGTWQPDLKGDKGIVSGQSKAVKIYEEQAADFVYEGNIALGVTGAEAALVFRTSADGSKGYEAVLKKERGSSPRTVAKIGRYI